MKKLDKEVTVELVNISDQEWASIHSMAIDLKERGHYQGHQGKCWVAGFLIWLAEREDLMEEPLGDLPH